MRAASAPAGRPTRPRSLRTELEKIAAAKPALAQAACRRRREGRRAGRSRGSSARSSFAAGPRDGLIRQASFKGSARGQAGRGDRARDAAEATASERRPAVARGQASAHPSGAHPVAGAGHHQAGPGRVLRRHRRLDPAARRRPRAEPGALPVRRQRQKCFFAKHAWAGLERRGARVDVGEKEPMLAIDNLAGLIDLVQAGVRGDPSLGLARRRSGAARPADLRSRSRRGRAVERGDRGGARGARAARRRSA